MWLNVRKTDTYRGKYRLYAATCTGCGKEHLRTKNNLENSKSCRPCALAPRAHGQVGSGTYSTWLNMKDRCNNPNNKHYANYGGRGIRVCAAWEDFRAFYADMGDRPAFTLIERVDNNAGYSPENCVWTTRSKNMRNRRNSRMITAFGRTQNLCAWGAELGLARQTIKRRLARGVPPEQALRVGVICK